MDKPYIEWAPGDFYLLVSDVLRSVLTKLYISGRWKYPIFSYFCQFLAPGSLLLDIRLACRIAQQFVVYLHEVLRIGDASFFSQIQQAFCFS